MLVDGTDVVVHKVRLGCRSCGSASAWIRCTIGPDQMPVIPGEGTWWAAHFEPFHLTWTAAADGKPVAWTGPAA